MAITRHHLDVRRPCLRSAAELLVVARSDRQAADLSSTVAVLPSARAGRRLLEILVEVAEDRDLRLVPPEITTVGELPEALYHAKRPFADDLTQQFVWAQCLKELDGNLRQHVVREVPATDDTMGWLDLGALLQRLHRELAAEVLDFTDVLKCSKAVDAFNERRRWEALVEVQHQYHRRLDSLNLWDRQTARRIAIEQHECHTECHIVLIGAVDMERAMRLMLDQIADRVTALIHAPEDWSERFDAHGCVIPEAWREALTDVDDERILQVDGPLDQAGEVARRIAAFDARFRADEITVGVPDQRVVPQIERELRQCGVATRWSAGVQISETPLYKLLDATARYLEDARFEHLAALVRHPDIHRWLGRRQIDTDVLTRFDQLFTNRLPTQIPRNASDARVRAAVDAVDSLTVQLRGGGRPLAKWSQPVVELLLQVYGGRDLNVEQPADRLIVKTCDVVREAIDGAGSLPESVAPDLSASDALRLLMRQIQSGRVAPAADEAAVDLVGWLELALDDAPALIVTSFNEGCVSTSINHDLFLPNRLRRALGILDNDRRFARDVYALSVIVAPWRDVTLIFGRRDADNYPLQPSRLLFATDIDTVTRRAARFFAALDTSHAPPGLVGAWRSSRRSSAFDVPRPEPLPGPIEKLSVTAFRSYLACPYRFYLRHVLRLEQLGDTAEEMDARLFGTVTHEVLQQFACGPDAQSSDAEHIERVLHDQLKQEVTRRFGQHPAAAVAVQIEQLRRRLSAFARWQAAWFSEGWRIEHAEVPEPGVYAQFDVDGQPVSLSGRIDRIDVNRETGQHVIFDYKTGDAARAPDATHRYKGEWTDLQLPLYRHLAATLGVMGDLQFGYILLPKDTKRAGASFADWTDAELETADEVARDVIRQIRQEVFWPPTDPAPVFCEDLAGICMDGVFGKPRYVAEAST